MPQLMIVVAAGVAAYAGYRWFQKQLDRSEGAMRHAEGELRRAAEAKAGQPGAAAKDLGALEWDESSGAYRPKQVN
ncbi:MAG: hypothetical protein K2Y05_05205 [Hyphomicrobiaceae bacterium]|nr:hypothetical protein [Hyphomicrobiaceae bacterium]